MFPPEQSSFLPDQPKIKFGRQGPGRKWSALPEFLLRSVSSTGKPGAHGQTVVRRRLQFMVLLINPNPLP